DKLYKLQLNVGGKSKQIVAGVAKQYTPEELVGRKIAVIDNLEPAVIRGERSEGMLLAALDGEVISLLTPDKDVSPGSKVM
ncbi:MAG: methionine--tRNA ligase, partial [Methanobacteriota archaeon]